MNFEPIFIGGLDRTGKSLMRLALSLHPNIIITKRTDLWVKHYKRFGDLSKPQNLEKCLSAIMTSKHIKTLKTDLNLLRSDFNSNQPTYGRLFALFHEQLAKREHKSRWGDQSELIEAFADPIFEAYPSAKFIHMIRDPRDRYSASKQKWTTSKGKAGAATAKWFYSARLAMKNSEKYPDNYLIVRYEDLVNHPAKVIEDACTFLGEEYFPSMLLIGHNRGAEGDITRPEMPQQNHFMKNFIGEYKFNLSKFEIHFIQKVFPAYMQGYKYNPVSLQFSTKETMLFWVKHFPRNFGGFIAWLVYQSLNFLPEPPNYLTSRNSGFHPAKEPVVKNFGEANYE